MTGAPATSHLKESAKDDGGRGQTISISLKARKGGLEEKRKDGSAGSGDRRMARWLRSDPDRTSKGFSEKTRGREIFSGNAVLKGERRRGAGGVLGWGVGGESEGHINQTGKRRPFMWRPRSAGHSFSKKGFGGARRR